LPPGLGYTVDYAGTLFAQVTITGTPTETGDFTFTVTATNPGGTTSQDYTVTVLDTAPTSFSTMGPTAGYPDTWGPFATVYTYPSLPTTFGWQRATIAVQPVNDVYPTADLVITHDIPGLTVEYGVNAFGWRLGQLVGTPTTVGDTYTIIATATNEWGTYTQTWTGVSVFM
jgi:hypothetical protein